jgi:hypothetical protein
MGMCARDVDRGEKNNKSWAIMCGSFIGVFLYEE